MSEIPQGRSRIRGDIYEQYELHKQLAGCRYLSTTSITFSTAPIDNAGMTITAMNRKKSWKRKQSFKMAA
jgi:hypothetical protein